MRKRVRLVQDMSGESRTEQSHKNSCNIEKIISRYYKTGLLQQRLQKGVYGDFTGYGEYHECVTKLQDAHGDFMAIPAKIRKRFHNDPGELIEFVLDESNRDEAVELGLVPEIEQSEQAEVPSEAPEEPQEG